MHKIGIPGFKYYVGIDSLADIATRNDKVCVLNILGSESKEVTPVGHDYSGGNVVFGTSPGRRGQALQTRSGAIPVYNSVKEGLEDGHRFNCGVVYLPPAAARDGVAELVRVNPELRKIFIVTEKISARDAREIRAMGQSFGIDIFGANCLGVADAWHQVRIGGALGGESPEDSLRRGSIAVFSNSGGFTTTIATYLAMAGWGTTTLISSGKDLYIHFAAPEFAHALSRDDRSKAAVLYVEPGGYYEADARFDKPVVACVVGRWKSRLTRPVGHAGAMAGENDDAVAKEKWFMEKLGVDGIYTPERPVFSSRGAVVTNIAHIAAALTAVMAENGVDRDFAPAGSMGLKAWFGANQGLALPAELDLPVVQAPAPYAEQIEAIERQLGAVFPRQSMKNASGASWMDPASQVSSLHGTSMLEAACRSFESNLCLALLHDGGSTNDEAIVNLVAARSMGLHGTPELIAAQAAREAGNAPNTVIATACALVGPGSVHHVVGGVRALLEVFGQARVTDACHEEGPRPKGLLPQAACRHFFADAPDAQAQAMLDAVAARGIRSLFLKYLLAHDKCLSADGVAAALCATLAWQPLRAKRISLVSATNLPWALKLVGTALGASVDAPMHAPGMFCGAPLQEWLQRRTLTEACCAALFQRVPSDADAADAATLLGLLLTNGPGTISAQGAKGAVAADGPEEPGRVHLNKAVVGFLTHTGYAHGGNGYEGVSFLLEQFKRTALADPDSEQHGLDLDAMAEGYALRYAEYKAGQKAAGSLETMKIPGVHHPVFKDKPVNVDPREAFIARQMRAQGRYNVFHAYYQALVQALHRAGVSRNVYCVNVDGVIAALLLRMSWRSYREGECTEPQLERAAFTIFLYGRLLGCLAEIDDHLNRGRNMDTRTPASECRHVC